MASFPEKADFLAVGDSLKKLLQAPELLQSATIANPWFNISGIQKAIENMIPWFLPSEYSAFHARYAHQVGESQSVGLIMAGNLPLVGFHDLLMVWLAGNRAFVRLSRKDSILLPALRPLLPVSFQDQFDLVDQLPADSIDLLIATGSDNSARYFSHDFAHIPISIRKNRFSVAVLTGSETAEELDQLANDVLLFNGMGCRNVSNLLVPKDYDFSAFDTALRNWPVPSTEAFQQVLNWEKAVALTTKQSIFPEGMLVYKASTHLAPARVGELKVIAYDSQAAVLRILAENQEKLQCVVGRMGSVHAGQTQIPGLGDFADGEDTLQWMLNHQERT